MAIIGKQSPLRGVPERLEPRQRILLDSIRYCADMVGLCYARLRTGLHAVSKAEGTIPSELYVPIFVDAWSLVDAANRISPLLLALTPKKRVAKFTEYASATVDVRLTRNSAHHLSGRVDRLVKRKKLAWGSIGWVTVLSVDPLTCRSHSIAAGSMVNGMKVPFVNPLGEVIEGDLGLITLYGPESTVDISATVAAVVDVVRYLEGILAPQFKDLGGGLGDIYSSVDVGPKSVEKPDA